MKQMNRRQSAPYRSTPLVSLCRVLSNLRQDAWGNEEVVEEEEVRGLMEESLQLLQEVPDMQELQHLCGVVQGRGERVRLPPATVCVKWFILNSFKANVPTKVNILNPDAPTSLPQTFGAPCCPKPRTSPPPSPFPATHATTSSLSAPAAASPGISGAPGAARRQPAEEEVSLHPEEAGGPHQQVPEALHPQTKCNLLTGQMFRVRSSARFLPQKEAQNI